MFREDRRLVSSAVVAVVVEEEVEAMIMIHHRRTIHDRRAKRKLMARRPRQAQQEEMLGGRGFGRARRLVLRLGTLLGRGDRRKRRDRYREGLGLVGTARDPQVAGEVVVVVRVLQVEVRRTLLRGMRVRALEERVGDEGMPWCTKLC